jgi:glycosyltransferase involved in cell wall biosynthesis
VPWFRALAREPGIDLTVLYCMIPDARQQGDGFGVAFQWDIPMLQGYSYELLRNVSAHPSLTAFRGCDTPDIGRVVEERGFAALIVNGWVVKSCLQALWACRRLGIPCLVRGESNSLRPRPYWVRTLHHLLLKQYAAALPIGVANRQFYVANGMPEERLFDAPYCVDNERFAAQSAELQEHRNEIRRSWAIPESACTFVFCGKLEAKKRPFDALEALTRMVAAKGARPIHLLIVGDGPLRAQVHETVALRGLPVTLAGFLNQSEIARAYVAADCLVLPSDDGETWGLVVNEAMACGRPAIVSDRVGCHPDLIQDGTTGYVFPLGDIAALSARMRALADDPALPERLGGQARARIADYSIARVVEGTRRALDHVLGARAS